MIKIGTWVDDHAAIGGRHVVCKRARSQEGSRRVVVMDVTDGYMREHFAGELGELAHAKAKVATAERSDGFTFTMVTWGEGRAQRVVLRAGCRFHRGVKSALARWKPTYRVKEQQSTARRERRRALNAESRRIVKTLAKQLGLPTT